MDKEFKAERAHNVENWAPIAALDDANPFLTQAYLRATEHVGEPWKLAVFDGSNKLVVATGDGALPRTGIETEGGKKNRQNVVHVDLVRSHVA